MTAIIDYGAGNTASVANALDSLNELYIITNNEFEILRADRAILPGVGEASYAIKQLHKFNLYSALRMYRRPLLGICLGAQLLLDFSKEGNASCLGIIPGSTELFNDPNFETPHMGWNKIEFIKGSPLFNDMKKNEYFYFANSYYIPVSKYASSVSEHGIKFAASIEKNNFYGVQFHPEKSGTKGLQLINNFLSI